MNMSDELDYSSAVVHFLDRDSQEIKKAMMYPITRVELNEVINETVVAVRTFIVNDGKCVEEISMR